MKWYKKQLDELKKTKPELANLEPGTHEKSNRKVAATNKGTNKIVHNPVKLRNVNRPKTDA